MRASVASNWALNSFSDAIVDGDWMDSRGRVPPNVSPLSQAAVFCNASFLIWRLLIRGFVSIGNIGVIGCSSEGVLRRIISSSSKCNHALSFSQAHAPAAVPAGIRAVCWGVASLYTRSTEQDTLGREV